MKSKDDNKNRYTSHSLRRTSVCRLNQAGFSTESVKKRTGHNTNEGVMAYDVTNKEQIVAQCHALYGNDISMNTLETEKEKKLRID